MKVLQQHDGQNILVLGTEAFAGHGGIAYMNRHIVQGLAQGSSSVQVDFLSYFNHEAQVTPPTENIRLIAGGQSKLNMAAQALKMAWQKRRYGVVLATHINFLPIASMIARTHHARLILLLHGVEAWQPVNNFRLAQAIHQIDELWSVSQLTLQRFTQWSGVQVPSHVIHCPVDLTYFHPPVDPDPHSVRARYKLADCLVVLTVARLSARERYKGVDEILEALATITATYPDVVYVIVGDGDDRLRLEHKAKALDLLEHVLFVGRVSDEDKRAFYQIADVYAMPNKGEGFGIVFLEALACGCPVIASQVDGSFEAIKQGELGLAVDPDEAQQIVQALLAQLERGRLAEQPEALREFSLPTFYKRLNRLIHNKEQLAEYSHSQAE